MESVSVLIFLGSLMQGYNIFFFFESVARLFATSKISLLVTVVYNL